MEVPYAESFDSLSHTFTRDQEFCNDFARTHAESIGRMLFCLRWAQNYVHPIQDDLCALVPTHFRNNATDAGFWTLTLIGGIYKDLGLIPYLAVRGLIWDAGFAARRRLESVGILGHLWADPRKAACLSKPESREFRNAFVSEPVKGKADELKARKIQKRFAASPSAPAASALYRILSAYSVHGGSPNQLVTYPLEPTPYSCMLINRPLPSDVHVVQGVPIFQAACEMLCLEVSLLHGRYGKSYGILPSKGGEEGFVLSQFLASREEWIRRNLEDFGWTNETTK